MELVLLAKLAGVFAYSALEYWLGKTNKVKSGSVIELVVEGVKYILRGKLGAPRS